MPNKPMEENVSTNLRILYEMEKLSKEIQATTKENAKLIELGKKLCISYASVRDFEMLDLVSNEMHELAVQTETLKNEYINKYNYLCDQLSI